LTAVNDRAGRGRASLARRHAPAGAARAAPGAEEEATMRIAVGSQNYRTVTPHAGRTRRWLVFEAAEGVAPVEVARLDLPKAMALHGWEGGGAPHPLHAMDAVLVGSCGAGFIRRMAGHGVRAAVAACEDPLEAVVAFLASGAMERPLSAFASHEAAGGDPRAHDHDHDHGACACAGKA
jgi:hypothetical protein